ncbi:hypothetical protein CQW39_16615 [Streptomyces griseofuscus]|nr:hypothetical protein CQW39_16615 [Streptomyces griseofuscus]
MSVDGEAVRPEGEADEPGWEVDPDDEWGVAVITMVGRQLKLLREAAGLRAAEFGALVGCGEDLVYKVEAGKRIPRREYLVDADRVLNANGVIEATWEDVRKVRYPKTVRDLGKLGPYGYGRASYDDHLTTTPASDPGPAPVRPRPALLVGFPPCTYSTTPPSPR